MSIRSIVPTARSGSTGKVVSAREAVRLIRIGDTVAIGGFFEIGLALEVIHELVALFEATDEESAYDIALNYAQRRSQFGQAIAKNQMIQSMLVEMLGQVTAMQLYGIRLGRLIDDGKMSDTMASLAKCFCTVKARHVCHLARDVLGGNGIPAGFPRDAPPVRHGGTRDLRGHRGDPDAHRRPRHHWAERLRLMRSASGVATGRLGRPAQRLQGERSTGRPRGRTRSRVPATPPPPKTVRQPGGCGERGAPEPDQPVIDGDTENRLEIRYLVLNPTG